MNRQTCTPERPFQSTDHGYWCHPNAVEVGEQEDGYPGGDIVRYECPHCGHRWREELPQ